MQYASICRDFILTLTLQLYIISISISAPTMAKPSAGTVMTSKILAFIQLSLPITICDNRSVTIWRYSKWPTKYPEMRTLLPEAGGRLNKKDGLTRYVDSHVKDKTS